jgi:hypothetical protein
LNRVDPDRLIVGTNFLYESLDQGTTVTSLGGPLTDLTTDTLDNDGDTMFNEADEFAPTGPVGPVDPSALTGNPLANPIAYGGMADGLPNASVLWVGANGGLRLRTMGSGLPAVVPEYGAAGGAAVIDIVMDPDDWHIAYILDVNGSVFQAITDDPGANTTFTNLTGNLTTFTPPFLNLQGGLTSDFRTIEFVRSGSDEILLVGGQLGVYRAVNPVTAQPVWTEVGVNLPNAIAQELSYDATVDLLVVATFGRGM